MITFQINNITLTNSLNLTLSLNSLNLNLDLTDLAALFLTLIKIKNHFHRCRFSVTKLFNMFYACSNNHEGQILLQED